MHPPPVRVVKRGEWWRLEEPDGTLVPGHKYETREHAERVARARNAATESGRRHS